MRVMVVGGGGREQALARKLAPECDEISVSPGNPGNETLAISTGIEPTNVAGQLRAARHYKIDLTIVGDDNALEQGIGDAFREKKRLIFGPTREQARIEWDRQYAKQIGLWLGVPMGAYRHFDNLKDAQAYATDRPWPLFVKDNGLAKGKGAHKCENMDELTEVASHLASFVVEDFVAGPEASMHSFCDGKHALTIPFLVRDHKNIGVNDTGEMTGGMGTAGPLANYSPLNVDTLGNRCAAPVVRETGFEGLLFTGLKGKRREERVIEWNARWGDPETQSYLALMKSPLLPVIMACVEQELANVQAPQWSLGESVVSLVIAVPGYPQNPQTNLLIEGIEDAERLPGVTVLQAATKRQNSNLFSTGGRVLNIVATGQNLDQVLDVAHGAASRITLNGQPGVTRPDLGHSLLAE